MSELHYKTAEHGGPDEAQIVMLSEAIRAATADYVTGHEDPRHALALLMTATSMYAGTIFASLLFLGEVTQRDTSRAAKMASTNFRAGIKVGLSRATRVGHATGYIGRPQ